MSALGPRAAEEAGSSSAATLPALSLAEAALTRARSDAAAGEDRARRFFDVAVTLLLLPFALLIGLAVSALILLDSPGSVFFRQERVGKDGRPFQMLKFRKMRRSAKGGPLTVADDARFTPIGRLLSLTKLDELPQLWNVLTGDMHLVGPRPEVPEFVDRYRELYGPILAVRPGITGPAAVEYASEGHLLAMQQDPLRYYEEQLMPRKIGIDRRYVENRTLRGDVRILAATLLVPLMKVETRLWGRGGHAVGHAVGHAFVLSSVVALALTFVAANGL